MYYQGRGVPQDYAEAAKWWARAAEQDVGLAQLALGGMYGAGEGVPQDSVRAHMWLNLAVKNAPGQSSEVAVAARDILAASMTPAQIAKAERLAREWKPKKE